MFVDTAGVDKPIFFFDKYKEKDRVNLNLRNVVDLK